MADTRHTLLIKGATTLSLAGLVFAASPAHDSLADVGPFEAKFRQDNPLMMPAGAGMYSKPALVDIDADGDLDLFVGDAEGIIQYFENIGTDSAADFEMRTGSASPFWYANTDTTIPAPYVPYEVNSGKAAPAFADIDGDGDMDAFVGNYPGAISYFENIGTASAPQFTERTGTDGMSPFWGECGTNYYPRSWGTNSSPTFVDIDGDGDMDLFVGLHYGDTGFFENTGTPTSPVFTEPDSGDGPFNYDVGYDASPAFADIDGDGDMDAFIGKNYGYIYFLRNIGTAQEPEFERQWGGEGHPLADVDVDFNSAPVFGDIDNDGDMDAFIGSGEGAVYTFKNTGSQEDPAFTELRGKASPTWGFDVVRKSRPAFVDIDGDGDMDAFVGNNTGNVYFMENTGTSQNPVFAEPANFDNPANPLYGFDGEWYACPAFVDIDGDGDMDAFVGAGNSTLEYFKNIGTDAAPDLIQMPAGENPLAGYVESYDHWSPVFADIDNDGDMDAFNYHGEFVFYQNIGSATEPNFTFGFPIPEVSVGTYGSPAFMDADDDGDMDLFMGTAEGAIRYFENTGTAEEPIFTEWTGTDAPFARYLLEGALDYTGPAFVDIDGDGDMDLFVGEDYGRLLYFENQAPAETPAVGLPADDDDNDFCFIDTVSGKTGAPFSVLGTIKNFCASLLALVR